jgi:hypothetical protein
LIEEKENERAQSKAARAQRLRGAIKFQRDTEVHPGAARAWQSDFRATSHGLDVHARDEDRRRGRVAAAATAVTTGEAAAAAAVTTGEDFFLNANRSGARSVGLFWHSSGALEQRRLVEAIEPSLWAWGVLGAENLLLHNVCTPRKLSNGASVYLWKLAFETEADLAEARRAVAAAGPLPDGMPGARVATVPTPLHVWVASRTANVSDVASRAGDEGTALGEWWTFPVARRPGGVLRLCQRIPLHGLQAAMLGAKVLYSDAHPLHDASVRSDFKSQSKTMRMVVSECLEDRALSPHLRISSLVVQASRFTAGIWFKLFRAGTEQEIRRTAFRMCMRHPDELHAWERAYDDWGIYRAELAEEALFELRRLRRERKVPQARRRPSPESARPQRVLPSATTLPTPHSSANAFSTDLTRHSDPPP